MVPGMRKNGMSFYCLCFGLNPSGLYTQSYVPRQQQQAPGARKENDLADFISGKQWHAPKSAFRPKAATGATSSWAKRVEERTALAAMRAKEKEMKEEKEAERQKRIQAIRDKRAAKEERERHERLAQKMHQKRVDRLKRREKRNKLLKS
ncbi:hypothetical protein FGG08_000843 [Glutinoglossum americanum]|uniref:rRNA-processing protein n=1 Tax=Glutinoglossum americanum TaxID=1670608 RepID=A0A9P8I9G8_9PEZI|nr:hypothetical protein FGG08_000843 [Glutinoglossum americanum]